MQGLVGTLREESKDADKEDILDVSFLTEDQDQANIIPDILNFIHNETFATSSEVDRKLLLWMRTAVKAIVELINEYVDHPFVKDGQKACEDFLRQAFDLIGKSKLVNTMELINFLRVIVSFGNHFSVGIILISMILEQLHRTGELLIQSFHAHSMSAPFNDIFRVYIRFLCSLLPDFGHTASVVIGVGNAEKDKLVIPKVKLAEIRRFSHYLDNWAKLIDISLIGFCKVSKDASADLLQVKKLISDIKQKIFLKKIK